ncbi:transcription factor bHLH112 isoform X2 [Sesamum indicum]|uniref:Transcription factor bHLH112 isoform X2 n=1 Tax=Sesamum indicum TaxID=4182 RepID=A0A8M8UN25_SESIN|nr:transcription factor bHLH112 isoform X2 [Sesamum indicum]
MMQHKRSPVSLEQSNFMDLMPKRVKRTGVPLSSKEKKEKTDTASVLLEVMEYISFLHEQVKVLSAPYLCSTPTQSQDDETYSLRAKGLCLVPISFTVGVASSNGADIWAPIKTSLPNSRQLVVDEASVITQG